MKKILGLLLLVFSLAGCTQHLGNFTAASTTLYDGKNITENYLVKKNAVGESNCYIIVFIPTCATPKADEAVAKALMDGGGDFMQNVRIYSTNWYIPYIFGRFAIRVEGDVYKTRKADL